MDDVQKQQVIRELNRFLKGRYMGIHQYEQLIARAQEPELKDLLQRMQQHAKLGAQKIAERIQDLGGVPVDGVGVLGAMREWIQSFQKEPREARDILRDALVGENKYGIHFSHEMVAGDLDEESVRIVDMVLEEDKKRVEQLKQWLNRFETTQ